MAEPRSKVGFIGAGRVGTALAVALHAAGYPVVSVSSRTYASAEALATKLPGCRAFESAQDVVDAAELVFLTVPDDAIRSVAGALRWRAGVSVVHTSGSASRAVLEAATAQGAETGSLHPLQTFARVNAPIRLEGVVFGVEAEGALEATLNRLVADLGGTAIALRSEDKALYHAAAVLASNYVVTLSKLATDLWLRLGWERPAALRALLPLMQGAIDNLDAVGLPGALTGPVARGDVETVRRNLLALREAAPEALAAYRELALQTIPIAQAQGGLDDEAAAALRGLLEADDLIPQPPLRRRRGGDVAGFTQEVAKWRA